MEKTIKALDGLLTLAESLDSTRGPHNFELVTEGPHFRCKCLVCRKWVQTDRDKVWADLNGPAFEAYYCEACKAERA